MEPRKQQPTYATKVLSLFINNFSRYTVNKMCEVFKGNKFLMRASSFLKGLCPHSPYRQSVARALTTKCSHKLTGKNSDCGSTHLTIKTLWTPNIIQNYLGQHIHPKRKSLVISITKNRFELFELNNFWCENYKFLFKLFKDFSKLYINFLLVTLWSWLIKLCKYTNKLGYWNNFINQKCSLILLLIYSYLSPALGIRV